MSADFTSAFFPQHLALVTVGENVLPMGYWTVISKTPFRFLLGMGVGNHSLTLLRKHKEAALHLMPWSERERVVRAGHISGRSVNKAAHLGFTLQPAEKLQHTRLVAGADAAFELVLFRELTYISTEFAPLVMAVVAVHGGPAPADRQPIFYLSQDNFGTLGEQWRFEK